MKRTFLFLFSTLALFSCSNQIAENQDIHFTREDFQSQKLLSNPEKVVFEDTYNDPVCYWLIQDSLVMVQNQPQSDYMIEIFSLNTQKRILALATRGNGPGEFGSCQCIVPSSQSPIFYIKDAQQSKIYTVNIPQTLQTGELAIEKQFQYSEDIHPQTDICILNDTEYAGYHFWHLDDSTYNNGVPAIQKYEISNEPMEIKSQMSFMDKYSYFVADVNGGNLFRVADNQIWLAEFHKDRISIYDDSLHLIKTITGPDNYPLRYERHKSNIPMPFITFQNETSFRSYSSWTLTKDAVYLIYEHYDGKEFDPEHLQPVEVFRFDKEGNPQIAYQADRPLYSLSIDSRGEYLYTVSRPSYADAVEFIRYKLK